MRIYNIANTSDLLYASRNKWRQHLADTGQQFAKLAKGRVTDDHLNAVTFACESHSDRPAVRAWAHTVHRMQTCMDGDEFVPHASVIGHMYIDSPSPNRLFEQLTWEIIAATFGHAKNNSITLSSAPPQHLAVGESGVFLTAPVWPAAGDWRLTDGINGL